MSLVFAAIEAALREGEDESCDPVPRIGALIAEHGFAGLANRIMDEAPADTPLAVLVYLINIADFEADCRFRPGHPSLSLKPESDAWLREASDDRRIQVALLLNVCPLDSQEEREAVLTQLGRRRTYFYDQCTRAINSCNPNWKR